MTIGLYAGSFDPFTEGHAWMVENARGVFEKLYVAIGVNSTKGTPMFTMRERAGMIEDVIAQRTWKNVEVIQLAEGLLVQHARLIGAGYLVRGIRDADDLKAERGFLEYNHDIEPEVGTVFLMPPPELTKISSTAIKSLMSAGPGWPKFVRKYVPEPVLKKLMEKNEAK